MPVVDPSEEPFARAAATARRLGDALGTTHRAVVVLGSGWGEATAALGASTASVDYADVAGLAAPTVGGHRGRAVSVRIDGHPVLVLEGRSHLYEGLQPAEVVHAVRAAVLGGAGIVVLTNAAGGINPALRVGDGVLIADHLNLTARSPLTGPHPPAPHGSRFVDLTDLYDAGLRRQARDVAPELREGVYAGLVGPHFETPAEIRMLRSLGCDLVGMSTVLEAVAARHLGARVLGISLVTNAAAGMDGADLDHGSVLGVARAAAGRLGAQVGQILGAALRDAR